MLQHPFTEIRQLKEADDQTFLVDNQYCYMLKLQLYAHEIPFT
jgi:hypothetical protein